MSEQTAISWCDSTFNPWIGCTKVSPACDRCYAARQDAFRKWTPEGWGGPRRRTSDELWERPGKWNAAQFVQCEACGWRGELAAAGNTGACPGCGTVDRYRQARRRVFCASLADVFDNQVPPEWRADLFRLIEATPNLDWLLLTKRIGNAAQMMFLARGGHLPLLPNVWLGATICNQEEADRDIPKLLAVPARLRFLSIEPMLGPVYVEDIPDPAGGVCLKPLAGLRWIGNGQGRSEVRALGGRIDWVICGGESGPQARPFVLGHAKEIVRQCKAAGVAVHVKQLGARPVNREGVLHQISDRSGAILSEWPEELRVQEFPG